MRWWLVRWRMNVDAMVACEVEDICGCDGGLWAASTVHRGQRLLERNGGSGEGLCGVVMQWWWGHEGSASRPVERHGGGGCRGWERVVRVCTRLVQRY